MLDPRRYRRALYSAYAISSTAFSPTDLGSSLWSWHDASDASSFTLVSGKVSVWADKSGNARDLEQSTDSVRPTITSGAINGKDGVTFVGASNHWLLSNRGLAQDFELFYAMKMTSMDTTQRHIWAAGNDGYRISIYNNAGTDQLFGYFGAGVSLNYPDFLNPTIINAQINGASSFLRANGTSASVSAGTGNATALFGVSGTPFVGGNMLNAHIGEIIICKPVLSASQRERVLNYLKSKFSISF